MKTLASLVVILAFVHSSWAAANRSTVWVLANNQIYSTGYGYQYCTTNPGATATSITLLTTSKLSVTGKIIGIGTDTAANFIPNSAMLSYLSIVFTYNGTHSLTLSLGDPTISLLPLSTKILSGAAVDSTSTSTNILYSTPSTFPISILSNYRVLSPVGTAWLDFSAIQESYSATAPSPVSSILIIDYQSSSVIAINQFKDSTNSFFQIAIRTPTSSISSGTILSSSGCTTSGRKRSVDHLIHKRYLSCPTSGLDSSMSSSTVSTACTNANSIYASPLVPSSKTATNLQDAVARGVNIVNSLYTADYGYFSAASSKFATCASFGTLVAVSSFIFSQLF